LVIINFWLTIPFFTVFKAFPCLHENCPFSEIL
jgi:hypothetical protein